jgi:hypothetical protein
MSGDLTLSTAGITVAKRMLNAIQRQRDDFAELQRAINYRKLDAETQYQIRDHDFGVRYVNAVEAYWRKEGRQVLAIHPDLLAEVRVATSAKVQPEIYRTIPFLSPMVVFADPPKIQSWSSEDEVIEVIGFFIHGRSFQTRFVGADLNFTVKEQALNDGTLILSSHDPDMTKLGLVIVTEIFDKVTGDSKTFEYNRTGLDMSRSQSIDEIANELVQTYNWVDMGIGTGATRQSREKFMRDIYSLALGSIMYLCSTVLDTEVVPKSRIQRVQGKQRKPMKLTNIGWKVGPALSRLRREHERGKKSIPTGRVMPPHMRRCHFRVVWTGSGRTIPKTVFIAPHWVNRHLLADDGPTTVRAVR